MQDGLRYDSEDHCRIGFDLNPISGPSQLCQPGIAGCVSRLNMWRFMDAAIRLEVYFGFNESEIQHIPLNAILLGHFPGLNSAKM